jgi:hypothetical protein
MTTLQEVRDVFDQMRLAGIEVPPDKMVCRRVDRASALAVYHGRLYLLRDTTGTLDYADMDRPTVKATEIVGWL